MLLAPQGDADDEDEVRTVAVTQETGAAEQPHRADLRPAHHHEKTAEIRNIATAGGAGAEASPSSTTTAATTTTSTAAAELNMPPGSNSARANSSCLPGLADFGKMICEQMEAGLRRRTESFVREIFEKHRSQEQTSAGISRENLGAALKDLGMNVSASEADELFYTQDIDCDGWIAWSEFLQMSKTVTKLEEWTSSLPLSQLLADCMPVDEEAEADPVRAVSCLSADHVQVIASCFGKGLYVLLIEHIDRLKRAYACMDSKRASQEEAGKLRIFNSAFVM